jgi:hypothetical protein
MTDTQVVGIRPPDVLVPARLSKPTFSRLARQRFPRATTTQNNGEPARQIPDNRTVVHPAPTFEYMM